MTKEDRDIMFCPRCERESILLDERNYRDEYLCEVCDLRFQIDWEENE